MTTLADFPYIEDEEGEYSTSLETSKQPRFAVLSESHIKCLQDDEIKETRLILNISRPVACLLLTYYKWNLSYVCESWLHNHEKVLKTIGVSDEPGILELEFPYSECNICFETFSNDEIKSSWCGHPFCIDCWNQYIDTNINNRNCFKLKCPQPSCDAAVDEDMIQQLASESRKIQYDYFLLRSYVENNNDKELKWCPAPNCCYALSYETLYNDSSSSRSRMNYDVTCFCSHVFCWNCGEEGHTPVDCETVAKWMKKTRSEFKLTTSGWIIANTKPCPSCKIPIQKNKGCYHMTCRCGFDFCWLCLQGRCICYATRLEPVQIFEDVTHNNHAKNQLDRYSYYHQGWANNEISRKRALQNLNEMKTSKSLNTSKCGTYTELLYTLKLLVEFRGILKWSYVYGYYLPEDESAKIEFFDHIQGIAQVVLDKLHQCADIGFRRLRLKHDTKDKEFRQNLVSLTGVTERYFMNLVKDLENSLDVVRVKDYTG